MARSDQYDHVDAATNAASRPEAEKPDMDAIRAGGTGSAGSGTDSDESPEFALGVAATSAGSTAGVALDMSDSDDSVLTPEVKP